jgi:hypothetical protein
MKGFLYICKMRYDGKFYYKIGRTTNLGKREQTLKNANPFFEMVAKKISFRHEREEKEIHRVIKPYRFALEWFELNDEQYQRIFTDFQFQEYTEKERIENLRLSGLSTKRYCTDPQQYHVFRKPKVLKNGEKVYRWYYYYFDESKKQVQKACRGCKTRKEAEEYIRKL